MKHVIFLLWAVVWTVSARAEPLTLRQAVAIALEKSPELAVFSTEVRVAEARVVQAGLRPNPTVSLELEDFAGSGEFRGARELQTTLQLSQVIELGDRVRGRREVAQSARAVAIGEYELQRVEVLADVTEKFIAVAGAQQQLALERAAVAAAELTLKTVRERIAAGRTPVLEEKRAIIALARRRVSEQQAVHDLAAARRQLAATWGSTEVMFESAAADLFAVRSLPAFETVAGRLAASPQIVRWATEQRLREAEARLAQRKRTGDLTVSAGARRLEGPDALALVAGISVPLPVFDRNQAGIAEARSLVDKTESGRRAAETRLQAVLFAIYQELTHAARHVETVRREILPEAHEAFRLAEEGYRQGRFSYLDLLDAQQTVLEMSNEQLAAAVTYHKLVAEIERLTGQPLHAQGE